MAASGGGKASGRSGVAAMISGSVAPAGTVEKEHVDALAARILANMALGLEGSSKILCALRLTGVLKRPLPVDQANPNKSVLMLDVMKRAGAGTVLDDVMRIIGYTDGAQQAPFVSVVGVSGVGKTNTAYRLGQDRDACVILTRVVLKDSLTHAWSTLTRFVGACVSVQGTPLPHSTQASLVSAVVVLYGAHLEFVLDVLEAAKDQKADISPAELREVALRAQLNGFVQWQVVLRFQHKMSELLRESGDMMAEVFIIKKEVVQEWCDGLFARFRTIFGDSTLLVWAHDEAPALMRQFPSVLEHPDRPASTTTAPQGLFYVLLLAATTLSTIFTCGHMFLGTDLDMSQQMLSSYSPAQGRVKEVRVDTHLSKEDIREWYKTYLREDAAAALDDELLDALVGRPMFAAVFWSRLVAIARAGRSDMDMVAEALRDTAIRAREVAVSLVESMWTRRESARSGESPASIVQALGHAALMEADGNHGTRRIDDKSGLQLGIFMGVLNSDGSDVAFVREPSMIGALRKCTLERVYHSRDGIAENLKRLTWDSVDGGLEDCFAWALLTRCLRYREKRIPLRGLLEPFLKPLASEPDLWGGDFGAPALDEYTVQVDHGLHCDGEKWLGKCPLSLLESNPTAILHHTSDRMGGPDTMLLLTHILTGETKPLLFQLKNRAGGDGVRSALKSVDPGSWYTDQWTGPRDARVLTEMEAHRSLRQVLARNPSWALPVRAFLTARPFSTPLLAATAWLNHHEMAESQVLLLRATPAALSGANIVSEGLQEYDLPIRQTWPTCICPSPIRHWEGDPLPAIAPLPSPSRVSTTIELTGHGVRHEEMEAAVIEAAVIHERDAPTFTRSRPSLFSPIRIVTVRCTTFTQAMRVANSLTQFDPVFK